jgi:hypothetical protein
MTVERDDVVDVIGTDKTTGRVILTISDHLRWDKLEEHLSALEKKINAYMNFVRSGQLVENHPDARDRQVEIAVICRHEPTPEAVEFLDNARKDLQDRGVTFSYRTLPSPD